MIALVLSEQVTVLMFDVCYKCYVSDMLARGWPRIRGKFLRKRKEYWATLESNLA